MECSQATKPEKKSHLKISPCSLKSSHELSNWTARSAKSLLPGSRPCFCRCSTTPCQGMRRGWHHLNGLKFKSAKIKYNQIYVGYQAIHMFWFCYIIHWTITFLYFFCSFTLSSSPPAPAPKRGHPGGSCCPTPIPNRRRPYAWHQQNHGEFNQQPWRFPLNKDIWWYMFTGTAKYWVFNQQWGFDRENRGCTRIFRQVPSRAQLVQRLPAKLPGLKASTLGCCFTSISMRTICSEMSTPRDAKRESRPGKNLCQIHPNSTAKSSPRKPRRTKDTKALFPVMASSMYRPSCDRSDMGSGGPGPSQAPARQGCPVLGDPPAIPARFSRSNPTIATVGIPFSSFLYISIYHHLSYYIEYSIFIFHYL